MAQARTSGPADAANYILDRFFGLTDPFLDSSLSPLPLAGFQADAARRILRLLESRGGALLADSTGLGKTHVAMAVIERSIAAGTAPVVVLTPAALRRQWVRPLRQLARLMRLKLGLPGTTRGDAPGPTLEWSSHARLARGHLARRLPRLVVVDEAHAFRTPRTRRYRELARLCLGSRVLLLTATPINNSLSDLYFQLRLFLGDGDLADLGIADLRAGLRPERGRGMPGTRSLRTAIAALTVRRTRRVLESSAAGPRLRFPLRDPPNAVRYNLESGLGPGGLQAVLGEIEGLRLDVHGYGAARHGHGAGVHLLRISLLKRLESSTTALAVSVHRLAAFLRECELAIPTGALPMRGTLSLADPDQLQLGPLLNRCLPRGTDLAVLAESVTSDLERVRRIGTLLGTAGLADPKVAALRGLLHGPLAGRTALIFTEFRDTALHLHRALLPHHRIGMVTGREARLGTGRVPRKRVIDAFAPLSNGVDIARESRVDVLIATDVLSEGLNLQDCADVVSFDLPWNPIRLVQRLGRIDRLGSIHDRVRIHNFLPDSGLENILGLLDRIEEKLAAIRSAGSFDMPDLHEPGADVTGLRNVLRRLNHADPGLLPELEAEAESGFELEERVYALAGRRLSGRREPVDHQGPSSTAGSGPVSSSAGPLFATLSRPAGEASGWLVVASDRGLPRFLLVERGRVREDRSSALRMLADAASMPAAAGLTGGAGESTEASVSPALPPGSSDVVAAAARFLHRQRAPVRSADPAGRAARRLIQRLREVPGGASAAECSRAEVLLEQLRPGLGSGAAAALDRVLDEERSRPSGPDACAAFMDRLESLLQRRDRVAARLRSAERPCLVALFRLVPATDLVLEPERPR